MFSKGGRPRRVGARLAPKSGSLDSTLCIVFFTFRYDYLDVLYTSSMKNHKKVRGVAISMPFCDMKNATICIVARFVMLSFCD